jgi:hypothetical protein
MSIELLPCPFCGDEVDIERLGDSHRSTIYQCLNCGCSLETGEEWDHGGYWNKRANFDTELLATMKAERDEADRRVGAAERELANLKEELLTYKDLRSQRKRAAGYDDDTSFDDVWAAALAALKEKRANAQLHAGPPQDPNGGRETPQKAATS